MFSKSSITERINWSPSGAAEQPIDWPIIVLKQYARPRPWYNNAHDNQVGSRTYIACPGPLYAVWCGRWPFERPNFITRGEIVFREKNSNLKRGNTTVRHGRVVASVATEAARFQRKLRFDGKKNLLQLNTKNVFTLDRTPRFRCS